MRRLWIAFVLAGLAVFAPAQQPATGTSAPTPAPQQKPKPKPAKPIDPDSTGGVRGSAQKVEFKATYHGKPVAEIHIVIKNLDGSVAADCYTDGSGTCTAEVGPDNYIVTANGKGLTGELDVKFNDATTSVTVKLKKQSPPAS